MSILDSIKNLEEKEEGDCYKCQNFIPVDDEGKCDIYGIPNHGVSDCPDWQLADIWIGKRGYQ